jgi:hypothetical protein
MLAVYGGCDVMVEGERVPGEAAVRPKRCRDPLEAAATIGPRGQMQQRPPWARVVLPPKSDRCALASNVQAREQS